MWVWEASPCLREFSLVAALPSGVMGPVECWALRRLAAFCWGVDTLIWSFQLSGSLGGSRIWGLGWGLGWRKLFMRWELGIFLLFVTG